MDFYLKNEVLNLDEIENAGQEMADGWFQMLRLIKSVGSRIIDFLDQIESFQKMLWEKRKFVVETQYCIAVGSIDADFYPDIAACDGQWDEWEDQFGVDKEQSDLFNLGTSREDRRIDFLRTHPTLVLDTRYFEQEFVDRLLARYEDLDGTTDGVLVHSENWQALNLLGEKYRERVKCIYADPPFNTDETSFIYKNGYQHSSWCMMISQYLAKSLHVLRADGVIATAIDDLELHHLGLLADTVLGQDAKLGTLVVEIKPSGRTNDNFLATSHEYYLLHSLNPAGVEIAFFNLSEEQRQQYANEDEMGAYKWRDFLRTGGYSTPEERPNSYYPIYYNSKTGSISLTEHADWDVILPIDSYGRKRVWRKTPASFLIHLNSGEIQVNTKRGGGFKVQIIDRIKKGIRPKSVWVGKEYDASSHGTKLLTSMFGEANPFTYPKSLYATKDVLYIITGDEDDGYCIDVFAGSGTTGHAVINLNREDGGQRKFILVEMGDYFDTVLLPRIKKVTFSPEWKDGKPKRMATPEEAERSPRIVKYIRLESYEDALNNIEIDDHAGQAAMRFGFDDYLLRYMLNWETKQSETLLNVEKLVSPFSYQLNVHIDGQTRARVADVPETFNYLLGLSVRTRRVYDDDGRRYLVYQGETRENPGQVVAVIWRETAGWNEAGYERDRQFVAENGLVEGADLIYVNGDSFIPNAKALDPLFKARMFAGIQS